MAHTEKKVLVQPYSKFIPIPFEIPVVFVRHCISVTYCINIKNPENTCLKSKGIGGGQPHHYQLDVSSLKNIMWEAGPRIISRLTPNEQMWPSAKGASFLWGLGTSSPKHFYIFYLGQHYLRHFATMKQQITPGLGKNKGDISEI